MTIKMKFKFFIFLFIVISLLQGQSSLYQISFAGSDSLRQALNPVLYPDSVVHVKQISGFRDLFPSAPKAYMKHGLLVGSIASNWLSFYLKRQADIYYDKYKRSNNLSKLNYYYDKTSRYDAYATTMIVVSGVTLVSYLYFILRE